jgi:copper(I)-binding protein
MKRVRRSTKLVSMLLLLVIASAGLARATPSTIVVSDVWSRPATGTGVVYATLRNSGSNADRLIAASSPLATHVGLHQSSETKMSGMSMPMSNSSMGNMPMGGSMMSMKAVSSIPIPARGTTTLAPGGYHLMLDLRHDLKAGETIPLSLHFEHAGWIQTSARVRPIR